MVVDMTVPMWILIAVTGVVAVLMLRDLARDLSGR
jgi:hypothetical protein